MELLDLLDPTDLLLFVQHSVASYYRYTRGTNRHQSKVCRTNTNVKKKSHTHIHAAAVGVVV